VDQDNGSPLTGLPPIIRQGQCPTFFEVGDYRFQDLCRDLFEREPGIAVCNVYGPRGQKQNGIDLLALRQDGDAIEVGQCKCYQRFSPTNLSSASDEFFKYWEDHWSARNVKRFILFVACDLSRRQIQDAIIDQRQRFRAVGIVYEPWSNAQIRDKLRTRPEIVRTHLSPPDSWVQAICGSAAASFPTPSTRELPGVVQAAIVNQLEGLAALVSGDVERQLELMRSAWREGRRKEAQEWVASLRADQTRWSSLEPCVKAKVLVFEALLIVQTTDDTSRAQQLADEAHILAPSEKQARLRALIAHRKGNPEDALNLLAGEDDVDSKNLRAAILLEMGRIKECQDVLQFGSEVGNQ